MVAIPPTRPPTTASHAPTAGPATTKHSHQPSPTGGFTTIDTPPRRVAGVSHPYGRNSPRAPTHNRQPRHHSRPSHDHPQPPTTHPQQAQPRPNTTANPHQQGVLLPKTPLHGVSPACRSPMVAIPPTRPPTTASHATTAGPTTTEHSRQPTRPPTTASHNRQPRPRPCRFRATNLRLPLRTPRGGLPRAAWVPGRPGDIGSLSGTRRLGAPLHWCHA